MNPNDIRDQLKNEYPYRLELHAHTYPVSRCSEVSPTELVDIYRSLGFNGLVVTNHFYSGTLDELPENQRVDAYLEAYHQAKDYAEGYGMKIYLGAELRFDENANDYLLYGADEAILRQAREYFSKGLACSPAGGLSFCAASCSRRIPSARAWSLPIQRCWTEWRPTTCTAVTITPLLSPYATDLRSISPSPRAVPTFINPGRGHEGALALRARRLPEDSFGIAALLKSGDFVFELGGQAILLP